MRVSFKQCNPRCTIILIALALFLLILLLNSNTFLARDIMGVSDNGLGKNAGYDAEQGTRNIKCKSFEEKVLWSSGYTNNPEGSTAYRTWYPKHNCAEAQGGEMQDVETQDVETQDVETQDVETQEQDCFLSNVEAEARFIYHGVGDGPAEGYLQISDLDESICDNPQQGTYLRYAVHETLSEEGLTKGWSCGKNGNADARCGIDSENEPNLLTTCYGVKAYATPYSIIDIFSLNYTMCWSENG